MKDLAPDVQMKVIEYLIANEQTKEPSILPYMMVLVCVSAVVFYLGRISK